MYTREMPVDEWTPLRQMRPKRQMPQPAPAVEHFGERLRQSKYGHRLTREMYAVPNKKPSAVRPREDVGEAFWASQAWAYEDEAHTILSDEFCSQQHDNALENFDLNMAFFAQIPADAFEDALTELLVKNKSLREVTDLKTLDWEEGAYVMVLDGYRQAYIGQAVDMRARIRRHWTTSKQFDRLLWGHKHESVLSVDSFRALDTTRIFAAKTIDADRLERRLVKNFPPDFLLNRIEGGVLTAVRGTFIATEIKRRQLVTDPGVAPDVSGGS
ncbi:GIY-YIG nuclease family protein [Arthrobacter sp. MDT3-24]